jgi:hypothetical protein
MAEDCKDCTDRTPVLPKYSKAVPFVNPNCESCDNGSIYTPPGGGFGGKSTELIEGTDIDIQDISDTLVDRFIISYDPQVNLTVGLQLEKRFNGNILSDPILILGVVVDEVNLVWAYNRNNDVVAQELSSPLVDPVIGATLRAYQYIGVIITQTTAFRITGDDGEGVAGSEATASRSVLFGNYRCWGVGVRRDLGFTTVANMTSFLESLIGGLGTKETTNTRAKDNLVGEGGNDQYFYYFYPKSFDGGDSFATFLQYGNPGGFKRLGRVGGIMEVVPLDSYGGGETDLLISNGVESEAYFVYQSTNGNINGAQIEVQ